MLSVPLANFEQRLIPQPSNPPMYIDPKYISKEQTLLKIKCKNLTGDDLKIYVIPTCEQILKYVENCHLAQKYVS